jgi:glycosyltransferase involved in cell wall biosynthesis
MKIGIDISQIVYGTGVSNYTKNLVLNLLLIDEKNKYLLFGGSLRRISDFRAFGQDYLFKINKNFEEKFWPIPPSLSHLLWNKIHFPQIELFTGKIDVFHSSDWSQPPSRAFKITTIHDLVPLLFPKETHPRIVAAHKARLYWVKKEVDRIIVPSMATKNDLLNFGFKEQIVRVIPEAPEPFFRPVLEGEVEKVKLKIGISGKYLLCVGADGRKNIDNIKLAFKEIKRQGSAEELIIVGRNLGKKPKDGIKYIGFVSDFELRALYNGAEALVFASLYEGFGLPILEAMASGCPVVTSNLSSMPETAGNAAIFVDPKSSEAIAFGIKKAIKDKDKLSKKGLKRSREFSWKKNAEMTLKVYNEKT